jgi:hypothetical protein
MQYKLRRIVGSNKSSFQVWGFTAPNDIALMLSGCFFNVQIERVGSTLKVVYESGTSIIPNKKEVNNYGWPGVEIQKVEDNCLIG